MKDELPPPGWFLRPESWPSWMPDYTTPPYFARPNEPPGSAFAPLAGLRNLPPWLTSHLPEPPKDETAAQPNSSWNDLLNALPVAGLGRPLGMPPAPPIGQLGAGPRADFSAPTPWAPLPFGPPSTAPRAPSPRIAASPMWPVTPAQSDAGAATPIDESAAVQDAAFAAAQRMRRGVQRTTATPDTSSPPESTPEAGEPGWLARLRLNGVDSFYRGTLAGAGRLALMQHYASTPDEPDIDPRTKRWRDQLRKDYPQVVADLARYDGMRGSSSAGELAAAALGQFGGGLPTPESLVGVPAKAATLLRSVAKAGLQQGATNIAVDPVVQSLNVKAGVQDGYDPARTAAQGALGVVTGAAARSAAEVLGRPGRHTAYANYEAIPGHGTGHLPNLIEQPYAERAAYSADPRSSWVDPKTGGDVIYQSLGIDTLPTRKTIGAFEPTGGALEINPGWVSRPQIEVIRTGDGLGLSKETRRKLNAAEAVRGYVDAQNMSAWHLPVEVDHPSMGNSLSIKLDSPLDPSQMKRLTRIAKEFGFIGVADRNAAFSFIPQDTGRMLSAQVWSSLDQAIRNQGLPAPRPVRYHGEATNYQKQLAQTPGEGHATLTLRRRLQISPGTIEALDADPQFRAVMLNRLERDIESATPMGGVRPDIQRAREIIAQHGLRGLLEALARKEFLPTVLVPLGLAHLYEGDARQE